MLMSSSAGVGLAEVAGSSQFRTSLRCSSQRSAYSSSVDSNFPCLSLTWVFSALVVQHSWFVILYTVPIRLTLNVRNITVVSVVQVFMCTNFLLLPI